VQAQYFKVAGKCSLVSDASVHYGLPEMMPHGQSQPGGALFRLYQVPVLEPVLLKLHVIEVDENVRA
jgi:hypothetical protein